MDERPSRYRGRRRVPSTPPSRYAAVVTTAVVGAGVVALGVGAAMPDAKQDASQTTTLDDLETALADRSEVLDRASRASGGRGGLATSIAQAAPDVWMLPVYDYTYSSAFGYRWGTVHQGIDLAVPTGTPVNSVHAGTVIHSGWNGGYGYLVVVEHEGGVQTWYGHNSQLYVSVGDKVKAGDVVAAAGNTGNSFGSHVHFEVHVDGVAVEPVEWLAKHGVDVLSQTEELFQDAGA